MTRFEYSKEIMNQRDFHANPTQKFSINGKTIKTNLGAYDYPYWNGSNGDVPEKYTKIVKVGFRQSPYELFDELIEAGYDEIRVVLIASGMIRGYCEEYFWACNSQKAKEARARFRAEEKAKKEAQEKAEKEQAEIQRTCEKLAEATREIMADEKAQNEAQELKEAEAKEITSEEPEKATESKSEAQESTAHHSRIIIGSFDVSRELIDAYNRLGECKNLCGALKMYHQFKDVDGRFKEVNVLYHGNHSLPRNNMDEQEGERFYIRKIRDEFWLYWEYRGDVERWLLHDFSKAYFDVREG